MSERYLEQRAAGEAGGEGRGGQRRVAPRREARQARQAGGGAQPRVRQRAQVRHVQRRQRATAAAQSRYTLVTYACTTSI